MDLQILTKLESIERMLKEQRMLQKELLSFNDAAIYLEMSDAHLSQLTGNGVLPFYKPDGRKIWFKRDDLNQWLLSNRHDSYVEIRQQEFNDHQKQRRNKR